MSRQSWPTARIASPIALTSLTPPEAVSICAPGLPWSRHCRLREPRLDGFGAYRAAIIAWQDLDLGAEHFRGLAPADGEAPAFQHHHLLATREHIGQRRLPGPGAIGGVNIGATLGAANLTQIGEQELGERDHRPGIDVDRRPVHGGEDGVGNDGGPRDGKEFTACGDGHCGDLCGVRSGMRRFAGITSTSAYRARSRMIMEATRRFAACAASSHSRQRGLMLADGDIMARNPLPATLRSMDSRPGPSGRPGMTELVVEEAPQLP